MSKEDFEGIEENSGGVEWCSECNAIVIPREEYDLVPVDVYLKTGKYAKYVSLYCPNCNEYIGEREAK